MTSPDDIRTNARKILYLLTAEQHLRAGEDVAMDVLTSDLNRHQMSAQDQQLALEYAHEQGWLQGGPNAEVQLTEQGFALNFGQ
jgi:hypothetical protein